MNKNYQKIKSMFIFYNYKKQYFMIKLNKDINFIMRIIYFKIRIKSMSGF